MKTLTSRQLGLLGFYAAGMLAAAVLAVITKSGALRVLIVVAVVGLASAGQLLILLSTRNLLSLLRREERLRYDQGRKELKAQMTQLASRADPTRQTARMTRAREDVADLARALERRETEVAELGETLRRIEFELTLANTQAVRSSLGEAGNEYDSFEATDSPIAEDR